MKSVENEILSLGMAEQASNIFWSYDDIPFSSRKNSQQKFYRGLSAVSRPVRTFREEAIEAARKIGETAKGPVAILASGGLDSEFVIAAFLEAKVPFRIFAINFSSVNKDELFYLDRYCSQKNLSYIEIHLDILKFWEKSLEQVATLSGSVSPQVCAIMHVIDSIDEYVVIGDGDIDLFRQDGTFYDTWGEKWAYAPWLLKRNHPGCPAFFSFTSELEASMYLDPIVEDFMDEGWAFGDVSRFHYAKPFFYYHHLGNRFRPKIDIFKLLKEEDSAWRSFLVNKNPGGDSYFSMAYPLIRDCKLGKSSLNFDQAVKFDFNSDRSGMDKICRFSRPQGEGHHLILR